MTERSEERERNGKGEPRTPSLLFIAIK